MSDASDLSAGLLNAMDQGDPSGSQSEGGNQAPSAETAPSYDTNGLSPYAQNWLQQLPEGDRPKGSEYVRNWDQGFQRYAQGVQQRYAPYEQLGTVDDLKQLKQAFDYIRESPADFVKQMVDRGLLDPAALQQLQGNGQQGQQPPTFYDANGNPVQIPQPQDHSPQIKRLESALGGLAQTFEQQQNAAKAAEADKALDTYTSQLHEKHGDFNEMFVWQLMAQGQNGDQAVQAWKNEVQKAMAQQSQPRQVMNASSAPPQLAGPLNSSEDRAAALAGWINQNQQ